MHACSMPGSQTPLITQAHALLPAQLHAGAVTLVMSAGQEPAWMEAKPQEVDTTDNTAEGAGAGVR